jgi:hypothetical protein
MRMDQRPHQRHGMGSATAGRHISKDSLDEFDDSRQTVQDLIEEYQACEREDYLS